jgi:Ca-activated chloride channel family protein
MAYMIRRIVRISWTVTALALGIAFATGKAHLRRPDQRAHALYSKKEYEAAADVFQDPFWRAIALYRNGSFKEAAGIFAGFDSAEGLYNQGNALLFLGKYEEAAKAYNRALDQKPGWKEPKINQEIALARAKLLEFEGGNMSGGKIGADDYVINNNPDNSSPSPDEEEVIEGSTPMSDAELRAVWLRRVQTNPADFLRSKFAYQQQMKPPEAAK